MTTSEVHSEQYEAWQFTTDALSVLVLAMVLVFMSGVHCKQAYLDLFTAERKSLSHRNHKPPLTANYKAIVYTTCFAVIAFAWTLVFTAIQYNFSRFQCTMALAVCEKIGFFSSRGALYIVYLLRLHYTYGTSGFGWPPTTLKTIGTLIIVATIGLFLFTTITIVWYPVYIHDTNAIAFPWYCQIISAKPWVMYAGFGILLFDLVCSVASIVAFIIPLNHIRHEVEENNPTSYTDKVQKMRAVGVQYKTLVIVGSTTTLVWIVLLFVGKLFLATFFINLDYLFNAIVIVLMSSYYPHDAYYERICGLCICICGEPLTKPDQHYQSHATRRNLMIDVSNDTSSMFEHDRLDALIHKDLHQRKLLLHADAGHTTED